MRIYTQLYLFTVYIIDVAVRACLDNDIYKFLQVLTKLLKTTTAFIINQICWQFKNSEYLEINLQIRC